MAELFVFDWSGVISDDRRPVYEANIKLLEYYGKERIDFEEWKKRTRLTVVEFLNDHGIYGNPGKLTKQYKEYFNEISPSMPPKMYSEVPDVLEFLKLQEKRLSVLSAHPEENLKQEMKDYEIDDYFEFILGGVVDKVGGLERTCDAFGINKNKTLYTGNTIYDIQAVKQAGVQSACVFTGYHDEERLRAENPDYAFENLKGLISLS